MPARPLPLLLALLVAASLPGGAYHVTPPSGPAASDPYFWTTGSASPLEVGGADSIVCERPEAGPQPSTAGAGGLCFMSAGFYTDVAGLCTFGGRSNGQYDAYDSGACRVASEPQPMIAAVARHWYLVQMPGVPPTGPMQAIPFLGSIGRFSCDTASSSFVYDDQFAYTIASGHVEGIPMAEPGTTGTYSIQPYAGDPAADPSLEHCGFPFFVEASCCPSSPTPPPRHAEEYDYGPVVIRKQAAGAPYLEQTQPGCTVAASTATSMRVSCTPPTSASCTAPCTPPEWACHDPGLIAHSDAGTVTGDTWCTGGPKATATSTGGSAWSGVQSGSWRFPWYCEAQFSSGGEGYVLCDAPDPPLPWLPAHLEGLL